MTPNLLMLGREVRMSLDVMFGEAGPKSTLNHGEHVLHLKETLLKAHKIARSKAKNSAQRQKDNYDLHVRPYTYKVGDNVWYLQERADKGVKPSKDMASSRNLVSTIGALASPKMGDGTRCPEG